MIIQHNVFLSEKVKRKQMHVHGFDYIHIYTNKKKRVQKKCIPI